WPCFTVVSKQLRKLEKLLMIIRPHIFIILGPGYAPATQGNNNTIFPGQPPTAQKLISLSKHR
ncbi:MAG: hypothetical protein COB67_13875, partial [SAR324 cluster bacterium]